MYADMMSFLAEIVLAYKQRWLIVILYEDYPPATTTITTAHRHKQQQQLLCRDKKDVHPLPHKWREGWNVVDWLTIKTLTYSFYVRCMSVIARVGECLGQIQAHHINGMIVVVKINRNLYN